MAGRRNFANLTLKSDNTLYPFSSGFYPFPTLLSSDIFFFMFTCLFLAVSGVRCSSGVVHCSEQ